MSPSRILVVEDDLFLRELYVDTLMKNEGYLVDTAADGEEALKKIKIGGYDLILLDIILPKMNGLDVAKHVKEEPPQSPNKSLIFLTNIDKDEEIKMALELGDGYLIKSQINPESLVKEVKTQLAKLNATPKP